MDALMDPIINSAWQVGGWKFFERILTGFVNEPIHATAAQRAEAFLRILGKWEEEA